jgi:murein DD-endopeptidase MepM/ murein hydrolase activator NlpD
MGNFAEIQQMGRVSSQLRHDYKPGRPLPNRGRRPHRIALAAGIPIVGLLLAMALQDEPATRKADAETSESPRQALRRFELPLPGSRGDTGSAAEAREVPVGQSPVVEDQAAARQASEPGSDDGEANAVAAPVVAPPAGNEAATDIGDAQPEGESLVVRVKSGDSLDRLFRRHGLSVTDLANMLKVKEARNALALIKPGDEIGFVRDGDDVISLSRELSEDLTMRVVRSGDGYDVEFLANPVEQRRAQAHGRIKSSLFEAGADVGMSDTLIMNLAGIFAWDVDFALEIREGDSFSLVYEEIWQDEKRLRDGEILAAEFVNQGRVFRAVRYEDPDGRVDYFTPEGLSVRKAFLRAPLDFSRVSSNFNPNRLHPILKTRRPHRGVDYAAPRGTPIKAAGDGKIIFRGKNGGYGNCVIIQHGGNVTTLYAHLSKFAKNAPKGRRVNQGQVIGFVGSSGLATAPHLHYEYRLNGVHRNPRTVPLPEAEPVPRQYRASFQEASRPLLTQLDAISSTRLAQVN